MRPPTRSRASSNSTESPVWESPRAAESPAAPAPMITTSVDAGSGSVIAVPPAAWRGTSKQLRDGVQPTGPEPLGREQGGVQRDCAAIAENFSQELAQRGCVHHTVSRGAVDQVEVGYARRGA